MYYVTSVDNNGKILQKASAQFDSVLFGGRHPEGYAFIESEPSSDNSYWDFSSETWVLPTPQPSPYHVFNWQTKQWDDPRSLQDFKDAQWGVIKQARTQEEFGSFTYNNMVFDGDIDAQRRLSGYISISKSALAAEVPFSAVFTLANNTTVTLTAEDFVAIEIAKVQAVAAAFAKATALRGQIDAATTREQVEAAVWY